MLITKKNYDLILQELIELDKSLCKKLIKLFSDCNLEYLNLGGVGNSIASGYSKCDEMIPLFARTHLFDCENIRFYSYARVRRNEELNVLKWYHSNILHKDINQLLLDDILVKKEQYACFGDKQRKLYEMMADAATIGLKDYVKLDNNIMIYNGLSGSFTDILRKGEKKDKYKLLHSFRKDYEYLKIFLVETWLDNPHLQVYVCGLPDVLDLRLTNTFDYYIKKAIQLVPNAIYVKGASKNVFSLLNNQKELDYHYNKPEYLQLLCQVWKAILKNYVPITYKNEILYSLLNYNKRVEMQSTISKGNVEIIREIIGECTEKYKNLFIEYKVNEKKIKKEIWNFYDNNYLVHFGCTNRKKVKRELGI